MRQSAVLFTNILLVLLLGTFPASAQKKKPRSAPKKIIVVENPPAESMPEIKDFAFVVNIDKNSNLTLQAQKKEDSDVLTNASDVKTLKTIFSGGFNTKGSLSPILIVKAHSSINYSDLLSVINAFRVSPKQQAKVEISKDFYAFVPPKMRKNSPLRPNPLFLLVELDKNGKLNVNNEPMDDLNHLQKFLAQIFKDRADNGVIREGTNLTETTVLIKALPTVKFAEVIKIAEALKETGSTLIGLWVDEAFPEARKEIIINIMESPKIPERK